MAGTIEDLDAIMTHLDAITTTSSKVQEGMNSTLKDIKSLLADQNKTKAEESGYALEMLGNANETTEVLGNIGDFCKKIPVTGMLDIFGVDVGKGFIAPFVKMMPMFTKVFSGFEKFLIPGIGQALAVLSIVDVGIGLISQLLEQIPAIVIGLINGLINAMFSIVTGVVEIFMKLPVMLMDILLILPKMFLNILLQVFIMVVKMVAGFVTMAIKAVMAIPMYIVSAIADILTAIVDTLMDAIMQIADLVLDFIGQFAKFGIKIVMALVKLWALVPIMLLKIATKFLALAFDLLFEIISEFMSFIIDTVLAVPIIIVKGITKLLTAIFNIGDMVVDMVKGIIETIFKAIFSVAILYFVFTKLFSAHGLNMVQKFAQIVKSIFSGIGKFLEPFVLQMMKGFIEFFPAIAKEMSDLGFAIGGGILNAIKTLGNQFFAQFYEGKFLKIWNTVSGFVEDLIKKLNTWIKTLGGIEKGEDQLSFIWTSIKDLLGNVIDFMKDPMYKFLEDMFNDVIYPMLDILFAKLTGIGDRKVLMKERAYEEQKIQREREKGSSFTPEQQARFNALEMEIENAKNMGPFGMELVTADRLDQQKKLLAELLAEMRKNTKVTAEKKDSGGSAKSVPSPAGAGGPK